MPRQTVDSKREQDAGTVSRPFQTDNLEQWIDEDGVLHDPMAGAGKKAYRNKPTSEIRPASVTFQDLTGVTAEQGVPQPGPSLDALHDVGAIDDDEYDKRSREIEKPAEVFYEKQAKVEESQAKQRERGRIARGEQAPAEDKPKAARNGSAKAEEAKKDEPPAAAGA